MSISRILTELKGAALRGLLALPSPVVRFLAGRPIEREGWRASTDRQRGRSRNRGARRYAPAYRVVAFEATVDPPAAMQVDQTRTDRRHTAGRVQTVARIAVGGDSAGGNLATVVAQRRAGRGGPTFQLLIYPPTDFVTRRPSRRIYAEGFYLTKRYMDRAERLYVGDFADLGDPRLSSLYGELAALAPAYLVTAGFDPLRDEGAAYAEAMTVAGARAEYACERGLIHSFANMVSLGRSAPAAMSRAADALRRGLATR